MAYMQCLGINEQALRATKYRKYRKASLFLQVAERRPEVILGGFVRKKVHNPYRIRSTDLMVFTCLFRATKPDQPFLLTVLEDATEKSHVAHLSLRVLHHP